MSGPLPAEKPCEESWFRLVTQAAVGLGHVAHDLLNMLTAAAPCGLRTRAAGCGLTHWVLLEGERALGEHQEELLELFSGERFLVLSALVRGSEAVFHRAGNDRETSTVKSS